MNFIKWLFLLWDNHTTGFCRVLFALMLPSVVWQTFTQIYSIFLLILWLIIKTGYENKWKEEIVDERKTD